LAAGPVWPKPLMAQYTSRGLSAAQPRLAGAQPLGRAGAEVLDVDVRVLHQLVEHRRVGRLLGVERDAALVAVVGLEVRAVEAAAERAERIAAARLFDLHHLGAQVGQQHARRRPGDERALLQHLDAAEDFVHRVVSCVFVAGANSMQARRFLTMMDLHGYHRCHRSFEGPGISMELRHLRYFSALAGSLNFTRAAERLHVTQSTLSHQIKQLEEELGTLLFDRVGKRVALTEAGEAFLHSRTRALQEIDRGLGALREDPAPRPASCASARRTPSTSASFRTASRASSSAIRGCA
jgi:DNA-binding transcriptional ArsR family regulator